MKGYLYIVATPIGNLEDMTLRAIKTLKEVDLILTEDTRVTKKLLMHYEIDRPILSYHAHSNKNRQFEILKHLIEGENLALVTDAGTPGISDPGNELIDFLLGVEPDIKIVSIPGTSSLTSALSICGFDVGKVTFLGFFPKKGRGRLFLTLSEAKEAQVFFESPNRLKKTLGELREHLGDNRRVFIARELTKMHEETFRGTLVEANDWAGKATLKGEIVVIIEKS